MLTIDCLTYNDNLFRQNLNEKHYKIKKKKKQCELFINKNTTIYILLHIHKYNKQNVYLYKLFKQNEFQN